LRDCLFPFINSRGQKRFVRGRFPRRGDDHRDCDRVSSLTEISRVSAFPITARWPARSSDRLQLYSLPTPNGVKVSIMLEEIGLPYEVHLVDFNKDDQKTPEFLSLNPSGKIPAILDPDGPDGKPLGLFESGAILLSFWRSFAALFMQRRGHRGQGSSCSRRCAADAAARTNATAHPSPAADRRRRAWRRTGSAREIASLARRQA
jgi:glutathione S-transferase